LSECLRQAGIALREQQARYHWAAARLASWCCCRAPGQAWYAV